MNCLKTKKSVIVALAVILAAGCATIQKQESPFDRQGLFDALDKNKDGKIGRDEYYSIWKDTVEAEKYFRRFDKNGDGFLTFDEFRIPGITIFRW